MLAIALSLLFGFIAFAAIAQIHASVGYGARRGRLILAELARNERRVTRPAASPARRLAAA